MVIPKRKRDRRVHIAVVCGVSTLGILFLISIILSSMSHTSSYDEVQSGNHDNTNSNFWVVPNKAYNYQDKTSYVLVLGSGGLVGRALIAQLKSQEIPYLEVKNREHLDLRDPGAMHAFDNVTLSFVYWLAFEVGGAKLLSDPQADSLIAESTASMYTELIPWFKNHPHIPFVFFGTMYMSSKEGKHTAYGRAKAEGAATVMSMRNSRTVVLWNAYGPEPIGRRSHVISDWIMSCLRTGKVSSMTTGEEKRQFLHSTDVARALVSIKEHWDNLDVPKIIHLSSGVWSSLRDVAKLIMQKIPTCTINFSEGIPPKVKGGSDPKLTSEFHRKIWQSQITLEKGISKDIDFYKNFRKEENERKKPYLTFIVYSSSSSSLSSKDNNENWLNYFYKFATGCSRETFIEIILVSDSVDDVKHMSSCTIRHESNINSAIRYANGEYAALINSEEYISPALIERLLRLQLRPGALYLAETIDRTSIDTNDLDEDKCCYHRYINYKERRVTPVSMFPRCFASSYVLSRSFILSHIDHWTTIKGFPITSNIEFSWIITQIRFRTFPKLDIVILEQPILSIIPNIKTQDTPLMLDEHEYTTMLHYCKLLDSPFYLIEQKDWDMKPSQCLISQEKENLKYIKEIDIRIMTVSRRYVSIENVLSWIGSLRLYTNKDITPIVYGFDMEYDKTVTLTNLDNLLFYSRDVMRHENPPFSAIDYPLNYEQVISVYLNATFTFSKLFSSSNSPWILFTNTDEWNSKYIITLEQMKTYIETITSRNISSGSESESNQPTLCWYTEDDVGPKLNFILYHNFYSKDFLSIIESYASQWMFKTSPMTLPFIQAAGCIKGEPPFVSIKTKGEILKNSQLKTCWNRHIYRTTDKNTLPHSEDKRQRVCIAIPSTTQYRDVKMGRLTDWNTHTLINRLMKTMILGLPKSDSAKYRIVIYIGYDDGDPSYDHPPTLNKLINMLQELTKEYAIDFQFYRYPRVYGDVDYIWNSLFMQGLADGCEYFYQLCDDIAFADETPKPGKDWVTEFTTKLQNSNPPNLGVAFSIWTQPFVHRTHFDIFGTFYTHETRNWYGDTWLYQVYLRSKVAHNFNNHKVKHHNADHDGERYTICGKSSFEDMVNRDVKILKSHAKTLLQHPA